MSDYLKKFSGTLIAAFILVLLLGYLYFIELKKPDDEVTEERVFADMTKGQITELNLKYPNHAVVCKKEEGGWLIIIGSNKYKADEEVISTIIDSLSNMTTEKIISEDSANLTGFGLDTPRVEIVAKTPTKEHRLVVGGESPVGAGAYIRAGSENRVLLVERNFILGFLDKELNDFRDRQIISLDAEKITGMRFKSGGVSFEVERQNGEWVGKGILEYVKIDQGKIEGIMRTFSDLRINGFENDEPENLALYGLDTPSAEVELMENGQSVGILFGNKKEDGAYYAKLSSEDAVYSVSEFISNQVPKGLSDIRVARLVNVDADKVSQVEIKREEATISILKEADQWSVDDYSGREVDEFKIYEFLSAINSLHADKLVDDKPSDLAAYGLDNPEIEIAISEGDVSNKLLFGKTQEADVFVRLGDEGPVYLVSDKILSKIPFSRDELIGE
jgi:hypothetical protein